MERYNKMLKTYSENYIVDFRDVDRYYDIKIPQLLEIMGTVSTKHTNELGFDPFYLIRQGLAWILYEWKVDIETTKLYAQTIKIETFAVDRKGMYFIRYFGIYDKDDKLIGRAAAKWVVINTMQRKIVKLPQEILEAAKINIEELNENQKYIYDMPEKPLRLEKRQDDFIQTIFPIRFYDIDSNHHANNVKYVDWAIESLHQYEDFLKKYKVSHLSITYKKETGEDGDIICKTYMNNLRTYHEIYSSKNILLTVLELKWTERPQ